MVLANPLSIVEAAYRWHDDERRWLDGITESVGPYAVDAGVIVATLKCAPTPVVDRVLTGGGASPESARAVSEFFRALTPSTASALFAPTEFAGNVGWRVERLARARRTSVARLARGARMPPGWGFIGGHPSDRSIVVLFPTKQADLASSAPFPHPDRMALGLVAAHLGAALRLREVARPSADDALTEAVLSPDGKLLHATGAARHARSRASLTDAVLRSERGRGRVRRVDRAEALGLWEALVAGRWSVVEATERDGKRLLLARKNTLAAPDLLALTREESDVVWLAVYGHSLKFIAYELGLSTPAVSRRLTSALKKLRIGTRRELLQRLGVSSV